MRFLLSFLISLMSFNFLSAWASPSSDLSTLLTQVHSMQANFQQTVLDNRGKRIQRSDGKMALQRPGKFRWDVTRPIPQLIIANGTRLWIYDPDLDQVTIRPLAHVSTDAPGLLLSQVDTVLDRDFEVKEMQAAKGVRWFELLPRAKDNMFASIQLGFENNAIKEMRLRDHLGHNTQIQFNNIRTNIPLAANLFHFNPPANVDVIDETRKVRHAR